MNEFYGYFERKPSKWNIIEFLEQCDLEPYDKKENKPDKQRVKNWEKTRKSSKISGGSLIHIHNLTLLGSYFAIAGNTSKAITKATTKRKRESFRERKDDEVQKQTKVDDDHDDNSEEEEDTPGPKESLNFVLSGTKNWILSSGGNVNNIVAKRISANAKAIKKKRRISASEKATLCYGSSRIIDLTTNMRDWFSLMIGNS
ncbi:hypothetical protein RclHR1_09250009 [Rhizophagus clarus]|uniref:Uncharacterized protein n=1 Tax=Rhizophagus clarus TaxID=94130 RepID=A0A2Z6S3V6_9GLOM|nr:hypothetical protein RclHR1_09250009 [Rhizophagus clarus]GES94512.1 hypothetical protein GLOIN_2v1495217 [Rhizophagus clarus]